MVLNREMIISFLKQSKKEFFSEFNLNKLGLFGSFAQQSENAQSDIDILVEFEPNTENLFEKKSRLKQIIKEKFGRNVDISREKYLKPYFKNQIIETTIYV